MRYSIRYFIWIYKMFNVHDNYLNWITIHIETSISIYNATNAKTMSKLLQMMMMIIHSWNFNSGLISSRGHSYGRLDGILRKIPFELKLKWAVRIYILVSIKTVGNVSRAQCIQAFRIQIDCKSSNERFTLHLVIKLIHISFEFTLLLLQQKYKNEYFFLYHFKSHVSPSKV